MAPVFCECETVAGIHINKRADGHYYHNCGKRVPEKVINVMLEWQRKENQKNEHK